MGDFTRQTQLFGDWTPAATGDREDAVVQGNFDIFLTTARHLWAHV